MLSTQRKSNNLQTKHIAGVILAAGDSKRLGFPKQLLRFENKSFINCVIETALLADLDPVVVVLGSDYELIKKEITNTDRRLKISLNKDWKDGQSSTLRVAINSLPKTTLASIFFLIDQPQIPVDLVKRIANGFIEKPVPIVSPYVGEQRANPVLFSSKTFSLLCEVKGDQGGRSLFNLFKPTKIEWQDPRILIDVDTKEDYAKLNEAYGIHI